jgi:succinoglycan biosynthesis transport protein ExoP
MPEHKTADNDADRPAPAVLPAGLVTGPAGVEKGSFSGPTGLPAAGVPVNGARPGGAPVAAPVRDGPGHVAPVADHPTPPADGLAHSRARQWPALVTTTALALLLAPKTYTASAKLRVTPMDPQAMTGSATAAGEVPEDYLDTECVVIKSDAVLALALDKVARTRTLMASPHPLDALQAGVDANVSKKGKQVLEVTFESRYPREAEQIVGAVVDAYQTYNANYWSHTADTILNVLKGGSSSEQEKVKEDMARMDLIEKSTGQAMGANAEDSPAHDAVMSLRDAKNKADQEAIAARTTYEEAARSINGDPAKVAAVEATVKAYPFVANPEAMLKNAEDELQVQQARLADVRKDYLPDHPVVRMIQSRVDQLTIDAVVAAKHWQDSAEARQQAIAHSLADAQRAELEAVQNQVEYSQLKSEVDRINAEQNAIGSRIHTLDMSKGAGAVNISVLSNPRVDLLDVKPSKSRTLALAGVLGLLAGAGLACLRDWSDDRFRTMHAVRSAAGAPVLGAIPNIPAAVAATAADRGQVVHFDPFGDASESYRTLRTALQFGLPPRTKTLLVTSPTAGDGKSTLVSNLAIALAQANRRVLVVDADLRAPVQHRLFGLSDRTGLASVLDGTDTIDAAIRRTGVEGLDVLPAGPIPFNPAELLNTPAFGDHMNDLADRYDLVLIDSPPVTAVTDARILAASADASLLVVRLGSSTRRQTEAARDGLRGVGARLIGVAVNGVGRRGNLASASGYYARPGTTMATPVNLSVAAPPPTPEFLAGGRLGHDPLSDAVRTAPPASRR